MNGIQILNNFTLSIKPNIMRNIILLIVMFCFTQNFIFSQEIALPEELADNSIAYDVKGRWGWQINQVIKFGDYKTSKIKKGWIVTTHSNILDDFKKSKQKFSYTQYDPTGKEAYVNCFGELSQRDLPIIKDFLSWNLEYKNVFSGLIELADDSLSWRYLVNDPDTYPGDNQEMGYLESNTGDQIKIYGVNKLKGKKIPKLFQSQIFGYVFKENETILGAVSVYNKGKVYLPENSDDDINLLIASIATALLVRSNLEEQE